MPFNSNEFEFSTADDHVYSRPEPVADTNGINIGLGKCSISITGTTTEKKQASLDFLL